MKKSLLTSWLKQTDLQLSLNRSLLPQSQARKWYDTSANEIKVFIGLLILQGIDFKVENSMYFFLVRVLLLLSFAR